MKKKRIVGFFAFCLLAISLTGGLTAASAEETVSLDYPLESSYALGELVELPAGRLGETNCRISVQRETASGRRVEKSFAAGEPALFRFETEGDYYFVYEAEGEDGMRARNYRASVARRAYIEVENFQSALTPGTTVRVPAGRLVTEQGSLPCEVSVRLPGGGITTDAEFSASDIGTYEFVYSAEYGNARVEKVRRATCTIGYSDLFSGARGIRMNQPLPDYADAAGGPDHGVEITASAASVVRYRNPVDLDALGSERNLVSFQPLCEGDRTDFRSIEIRLTDVSDPSNVLTVRFKESGGGTGMEWNYPLSYLAAGVGGTLAGIDGDHVNFDPYGSVVVNNFYGAFGAQYCTNIYGTKITPHVFSFQIGERGRKIYSTGRNTAPGTQILALDFDDARIGMDWQGFSSGEVWLDFCFPVATDPRILVTEIAGMPLGGEAPTDRTGPHIYLETDADYAENRLPDAKVGAAYSVPVARARDLVTGDCAATPLVRSADGSRTLEIREGKVIPDRAGAYEIVYTARDGFGNLSERRVTFEAKAEIPAFSVRFAEPAGDWYAGIPFRLPEIQVSGGSGKMASETRLFFGEKAVEPDENGFLYFDKLGTLKIEIRVSDYLRSETLTETFEIGAYPSPVLGIRDLPIAVRKGERVVFPDFSAVDYATGAACRKSVYVNGELLGRDRAYLVKQTDERLEVEYIARAGGAESVERFTVEVLQSNAPIDAPLAPDFVLRASEGEAGFSFTASEDFAVRLPYPVFSEGFNLEFKLRAANAARAEILLTDAATETKCVRLILTPVNDRTSALQIGGDSKKYTVNGSFQNEAETFGFAWNEGVLFARGQRIAPLTVYEDGRKFDDFGDGRMYVQIGLSGVTQSSAILLYRAANQAFLSVGTFFSDAGPVLRYGASMRNLTVKQNERVKIASARALDVLSGASSVTVTLTAPDGSVPISNAACDTDAYFSATLFGKYRIAYRGVDADGKRTEEIWTITVCDTEPPEISVAGTLRENYRLGETITVPRAYASDAAGGETKLIVFLTDERNGTRAVEIGETIRLDRLGSYRLVYLAYDSENNTARKTLEFSVTEEEK